MTEFETRLRRIVRFAWAMIGIMSFFMVWRAFDLVTVRQKFNGLPTIPFEWTNLVYFGLGGFIIIYLLINISKIKRLQKQVEWKND